jgi:hypothetical protein
MSDNLQTGTHPLDNSPRFIQTTQVNQTNTMTLELATALLNKASTGDEILAILDSIIDEIQPVEELAQA